MKNYDEMSDFEVNKLVANFVDFGGLIVSNNDSEVLLMESDGLFSVVPIGVFDPCNNPSDAWPIIVERCISISPRHGKTSLVGVYGACQYECENGKELRTAMICFLKMKDAENGI